jgi:hypothetical protein
MFGLTPPFTYGFLTIHGEMEFGHRDEETWRFTAFALMGLFGWAVATGILWAPTSERFRYLTGRQRLKRPERRPIPLPAPVAVPEPEPAVVLQEVREADIQDGAADRNVCSTEIVQSPSPDNSAGDDSRQSL